MSPDPLPPVEIHLLQQNYGLGLGPLLLIAAASLLIIAALWKIFAKAAQPGWAALIPIFNLYILLQITGKPTWWLLLFLLPIANLVAAILVSLVLARRFGKSPSFALGLILLPFLFFPILAFSSASYQAQPS